MTRKRSYRILTIAAALLAAAGTALAASPHVATKTRADTIWTGAANPTGSGGTITPQDTIWTG